jgi:hypothetical protein
MLCVERILEIYARFSDVMQVYSTTEHDDFISEIFISSRFRTERY